jgi:hypothetical protein
MEEENLFSCDAFWARSKMGSPGRIVIKGPFWMMTESLGIQ